MGNVLHRLIWMKFISKLSMYAQFGTYMYFRWRIITVLTQIPAALMLRIQAPPPPPPPPIFFKYDFFFITIFYKEA